MTRLAVLLLACACGGKSGDEPARGTIDPPGSGSAPAAVPTKPAAGFEKLVTTVNGKSIAMQRGFIKRVSPDHWRILVGDIEGSCDELLSGIVNRQGGNSFVASLVKLVASDGSESFAVTDFWSAGHPTKASYAGAAKVTGASDQGKAAEIELPMITDIDDGKTLVVSGPLTATGCGDQAVPDPGTGGIPRATHVSAGTITVAGNKLELHGVVLHDTQIVLSTGPKDCSGLTPFAPITLRHDAGAWELSGTWITRPLTATDDSGTMKATSFKVGTQGTSADGPIAAVSLGGSGTIGGYKIELAGKVEAIDCPTN